jgi:HPt (histidine-containing phosphotransfer) domain-containing protein
MRPRTFAPTNRVAELLRRPGGVTAAEACARAERRVEAVRESSLAALDEKITALAASGDTPIAEIYSVATEIYSVAGTFGLKELAEAAQSLCELLNGAGRDDKFQDSVRVHVDALRTLRRPELSSDATARAAVVAGLRRVATRKAPAN